MYTAACLSTAGWGGHTEAAHLNKEIPFLNYCLPSAAITKMLVLNWVFARRKKQAHSCPANTSCVSGAIRPGQSAASLSWDLRGQPLLASRSPSYGGDKVFTGVGALAVIHCWWYNEERRNKGKDVHPVDRLANSLHQTWETGAYSWLHVDTQDIGDLPLS